MSVFDITWSHRKRKSPIFTCSTCNWSSYLIIMLQIKVRRSVNVSTAISVCSLKQVYLTYQPVLVSNLSIWHLFLSRHCLDDYTYHPQYLHKVVKVIYHPSTVLYCRGDLLRSIPSAMVWHWIFSFFPFVFMLNPSYPC